jgi:hydrogenase maturation factor HypF (carbamoyltransferase family)
LIDGVVEMAIRVSGYRYKESILSGGVMVNGYITHIAITTLKKLGLDVFLQKGVPPGDGGISLGQFCAALSGVT